MEFDMTGEEISRLLLNAYVSPARVRVTGGDYVYEGWVVASGHKVKSGKLRVVVEDDTGRWFVHNAEQLELAARRD